MAKALLKKNNFRVNARITFIIFTPNYYMLMNRYDPVVISSKNDQLPILYGINLMCFIHYCTYVISCLHLIYRINSGQDVTSYIIGTRPRLYPESLKKFYICA